MAKRPEDSTGAQFVLGKVPLVELQTLSHSVTRSVTVKTVYSKPVELLLEPLVVVDSGRSRLPVLPQAPCADSEHCQVREEEGRVPCVGGEERQVLGGLEHALERGSSQRLVSGVPLRAAQHCQRAQQDVQDERRSGQQVRPVDHDKHAGEGGHADRSCHDVVFKSSWNAYDSSCGRRRELLLIYTIRSCEFVLAEFGNFAASAKGCAELPNLSWVRVQFIICQCLPMCACGCVRACGYQRPLLA